jgi:hypothetical protein
MNLKNHKGLWCTFLNNLCQEGYCAECEIQRSAVNDPPAARLDDRTTGSVKSDRSDRFPDKKL